MNNLSLGMFALAASSQLDMSDYNGALSNGPDQHGSIPTHAYIRCNEVSPHGWRVEPLVRENPKIGRNEGCPCGSGKKYKQCCI